MNFATLVSVLEAKLTEGNSELYRVVLYIILSQILSHLSSQVLPFLDDPDSPQENVV